MKYSMYGVVWWWFIEAGDIMKNFTSCYKGNDAHDDACVCNNCIYLQLTILLEEYLELSVNSHSCEEN